MIFNSFAYILVFLPISLLGYILLRRTKLCNLWLLTCSIYFYAVGNWWWLIPFFISSLLDYYIGLKIFNSQNKNIRKYFLFISVSTNLLILSIFKYGSWIIESASLILPPLSAINFVVIGLPAGISFYTFQSMSYSIDIYRKDFTPHKGIIDYLSFVAFFPQLIAGPIMRAKDLLPQLVKKRNLINADVASSAIFMILFGLFQKIVLADNFGTLVEFVSEYLEPGSIGHLPPGLGYIYAYAFAGQIYCDFAAYSTIARGSAKLFNIDLMRNFLTPYFSSNPSEFWKRWHISLSTWLRDYVYIPLGGNRGTAALMIRNLFITMFLCGLWHGAGVLFIVWGLWHGLLLVIYKKFPLDLYLNRYLGKFGKVLSIIIFFNLVCIGWIFFRAPIEHIPAIFNSIILFPSSCIEAIKANIPYIKLAFNGTSPFLRTLLDIGWNLITSQGVMFICSWFLLLLYTVLFLFDFIGYRNKCEFPETFSKMKTIFQVIIIVVLLYLMLFFGRREANEFIYFAF